MPTAEPSKETVIIVHGTWAAPDPLKRRWYEPVDGRLEGEPFTAKLDAALQERGSPARCWAHCTEANPIFHWSGENSWIARTNAAAALADYVTKLRKEGWRFHIVAHSHGGNVVVEALPQILEPGSKIVTLGTPFVDTLSPLAKRAGRVRKIVSAISSTIVVLVMLYFVADIVWFLTKSNTTAEDYHVFLAFLFILFLLTGALLVHWWFGRKKQTGLWPTFSGTYPPKPALLAIGTPMDEAWQFLHHMRAVNNPLAVGSDPLRYVFSSLRLQVSRRAQVARIQGAKSYRDLRSIAKGIMLSMHACILLLPVYLAVSLPFEFQDLHSADAVAFMFGLLTVGLMLLIVLVFIITKFQGEAFFSVFLSPFRWCAHRVGYLTGIFPALITYGVRYWSWPVLLKTVMGLEGYRFKIPTIHQQDPSPVPDNFVKYENLPTDAERRALERRSAWVARHLGDVSQTFSTLAITAADISLLLRTVEEDQTLVHAAYYTDDECIARIADWIAGKATNG